MSAPEYKPSRARGRVLLVALFAIYLVLLTWIVLWKLQVPFVGDAAQRQVKLVPFVAVAGTGASSPVEVVGNALLFLPFGVYLGLLAPSWPWWKVAITVAAASLTLEMTQYVLAIGRSDLTDLVVNTAGGLAGLGLLAPARRRLRARTTPVLTRICAIGTVLAVLGCGAFIASPVRYGPPRGAVTSTPGPVDPSIGLRPPTP